MNVYQENKLVYMKKKKTHQYSLLSLKEQKRKFRILMIIEKI